jgi:hypothetical protein
VARHAAKDNIFPMAIPYQAQLFQRGELASTTTTTQTAQSVF